jgi:alpha-tubulin suppressor-like RCC1 family protein
VEVKGVSGKVNALAARGNNAFALIEGGQVLAWGLNSQGELATGSTMGPEPACGFEHHQVCSAKPVVAKLTDIKGRRRRRTGRA